MNWPLWSNWSNFNLHEVVKFYYNNSMVWRRNFPASQLLSLNNRRGGYWVRYWMIYRSRLQHVATFHLFAWAVEVFLSISTFGSLRYLHDEVLRPQRQWFKIAAGAKANIATGSKDVCWELGRMDPVSICLCCFFFSPWEDQPESVYHCFRTGVSFWSIFEFEICFQSVLLDECIWNLALKYAAWNLTVAYILDLAPTQ